jgi:two-component system OmpR family response regulator
LISPNGTVSPLTEAEMLALEAMIEAAGSPVSRDRVGRVALKRQLSSDDRSVDQLVLKLRRKLSGLGCPERVILSVRSQGYVLADPGLFQRPADAKAV